MQNNSGNVPVKIYKRSLSGGREPNNNRTNITKESNFAIKNNLSTDVGKSFDDDSDLFDRYSSIRRSISRSKERSSSRCMSSDEFNNNNNNSLRSSSLSSEISEKYRSCNPSSAESSLSIQDVILKSKTEYIGFQSPFKYYDTLPPPRRSCISPTKDQNCRPPASGFISPPLISHNNESPSSIRSRRSTSAAPTTTATTTSHRTISRFLRPDFFDTPREESSYYVRERKPYREFDTQSVLKEIRERSRERSLDRHLDRSTTDALTDRSYYSNIDPKYIRERRKSSIPNIWTSLDPTITSHMRNRSVDRYLNFDSESSSKRSDMNPKCRETLNNNNRYFKDNSDEHTSSFAGKIIGELQSLPLKQLDDKNNKKSSDLMVDISNGVNVKSDDVGKKEKLTKMKKLMCKQQSSGKSKNIIGDAKPVAVNNAKMVTSLTNEIDSVSLPKIETPSQQQQQQKPRKASKLVRPKSYPNKEPDIKRSSPDHIDPPKEQSTSLDVDNLPKSERPKSYPYPSKITPPKETNKFINNSKNSNSNGANCGIGQIEKSRSSPNDSNGKEKNLTTLKSTGITDNNSTTIKKNKIIKKNLKTISPPPLLQQPAMIQLEKDETRSSTMNKLHINAKDVKQTNEIVAAAPKEKSPEKKISRGFLYTIGQKFEKLRENTKNKEKKLIAKTPKTLNASEIVDNNNKSLLALNHSNNNEQTSIANRSYAASTTNNNEVIIPRSHIISDNQANIKKTVLINNNTGNDNNNKIPAERKSRIDTMIRNLRERSLPRGPAITESGLIKRAVSVEDMTGMTFNRCAVNKVLGLFKKIEKEQKLEQTKSSANIQTLITDRTHEQQDSDCQIYNVSKERPKSGGFVSKLKKGRAYTGAKSDSIVMLTDQFQKQIINADKLNGNSPKPFNNSQNCQNCNMNNEKNIVKRQLANMDSDKTLAIIDHKERIKNNRRGLVLDLGQSDSEKSSTINTIGYPALNNQKNNNNYIKSGSHSNQNNINEILTPTYDSITNYSSDSRSLHDDCASTSTFLSPTDEPELYFDDWSVCSEDNYSNTGVGTISTPSMSSRLSRNSQAASPISSGGTANCSESVIDRIKRRSFYSRFNDNKPKIRQYNGNVNGSNLTGAREYYREATAKLIKARPPPTPTSSSTFSSSTASATLSDRYNPHHSHHQHHHYRLTSTGNNEPYRSHSVTNYRSESSKSLVHNSNITTSNGTSNTNKKNSFFDDLQSYRPTNYNPLPPPYASSSVITSSHKALTSSGNDYNTTSNSGNRYTRDYFSCLNPNATTTKNSLYDSTTPMYGTYNPNRRISSVYSSNLDAYATLGKKQRPYNHRSISLLDSSTTSSSSTLPPSAVCINNTNSSAAINNVDSFGCYRKDSRATPDFGNIIRPNYRMRTPSIPRSPTNI